MLYINMIENENERQTMQAYYENNKRFLFNVAMKYLNDKNLSEDAVHNAFVDIITKKEKIVDMSDLEFKKWAITIVKAKAIDIIRKLKKKEMFLEDTTIVFSSDSYLPELEFITKHDKETLVKELSKLKEIDRVIIEYKYWHCLTYSEIADRVGLSEKNIEVRLQRAKSKLRKSLVKDGISYEEKRR